MSKKAIGALFMLAISFELLGIIEIASVSVHYSVSLVATTISYQGIVAAILSVTASILGMIAWIGTLVNLARTKSWTLFILAFFFSGIIVLIYLFRQEPAMQPPFAAQGPYGQQQWMAQPEQGYAQAPVPANVAFRYGLIGGGVLLLITLAWLALNIFVVPITMVENAIAASSGFAGALAFAYGIPVLLSLPVFFLAGQAAARRTGESKTGQSAAIRAWAWLTIINGILLLIDLVGTIQEFLFARAYSTNGVDLLPLLQPLFADIVQILLLLGVAAALGTLAGNLGTSWARNRQEINRGI